MPRTRATTIPTTTMPGEGSPRSLRWAMHEWLRERSTRAGGRACMRAFDRSDGYVDTVATHAGGVHVSGVSRCASPHACMCCTPTIGEGRAAEVDEVLTEHFHQGGHALMVSLTLRHHAGQPLAALLDAVISAGTDSVSGRRWDRLKGRRRLMTWVPGAPPEGSYRPGSLDQLRDGEYGPPAPVFVPRRSPRWYKPDTSLAPTWAPGRRSSLPRGQYGPPVPAPRYPVSSRPTYGPPAPRKVEAEALVDGVVGQIKTVEVTYGANGWHPHLHLLVLVDGRYTAASHRSIWEHFAEVWPASLQRYGESCSVAHGVDVRRVLPPSEDDGASMGRYLNKVQGGWGAGLELARSDLKSGRLGGEGPFELARRAFLEGDKAALALWHEYERATAGRAKLTWSPRLRALYSFPEAASDEELASVEVSSPVAARARWSADEWEQLRASWSVGPMLDALHSVGAIVSAWGGPGVEVRLPRSWHRLWLRPPPPPPDGLDPGYAA